MSGRVDAFIEAFNHAVVDHEKRDVFWDGKVFRADKRLNRIETFKALKQCENIVN